MYEPSPDDFALPPAPPPAAPSPNGRALRLLDEVRAARVRAAQTQAVLLGVSLFLVTMLAGAVVASALPSLGLSVMGVGLVSALALGVVIGVVLPRRRLGDVKRTATALASQLPELSFDLLAAVELSKALGTPSDFSPELARAFLQQVDARAATVVVDRLVDQRPTRRAAFVLLGAIVLSLGVTLVLGERVRAGLALALMPAGGGEPVRRMPITGDVELTYRYPAHTGLEPKTVPSTTGDVSAPTGTEVTYRTRADRDVEQAALLMASGARVALEVKGRVLEGRFLITENAQFHVAFLDGDEVVAEGPDQAITAEADQPPQVRLTKPVDGLELDLKNQTVTLAYEASDDYGLSALELTVTGAGAGGATPQRISLKPDLGRSTKGTYQWDLTPLRLSPGQQVTGTLVVTDNDAVKGPKSAATDPFTVKLYSSAEHRREALARAEALWGRLVDHLADRMEADDRQAQSSIDSVLASAPVDERATQLSTELKTLSGELNDEREPPTELVIALLNVSEELGRDARDIAMQRTVLLKLAGRIKGPNGRQELIDSPNGSYTKDLRRRLSAMLALDVQHSEKNVLYLEALLDRAKLDALKEMANQLKEDRRELSRLMEDFKKAPDDTSRDALLHQMEVLKQHMQELRQRMNELSKGIRDDFVNHEALEQLREDQSLENTLADVEKLLKEGKTDEALKRMQELAMEMDEMLENLDDAAERADEEADPELSRLYRQFEDELGETVARQEQLAEKTKALKDKARAQQKEKLERQGAQLKKELEEKLQALDESWAKLDVKHFGHAVEEQRGAARSANESVRQSLQSNDFDLAAEAAEKMEEAALSMALEAMQQRDREALNQNPPETRAETNKATEQLKRDAKKATDIAKQLQSLFPQDGQQLSEGDRQQLNELAKQQQRLQQNAQSLQQQMEAMAERAPVFDEEAEAQMEEASRRMRSAAERLGGKDPGRGHGEQQGAMQALKGLQQAMQQGGQGGASGKRGLPRPMRAGRGAGRGKDQEKVEIPDEDPLAAPRELRRDVMEAMKQGAPDRYKEQNKKYYEELVK